MFSKEKEAKEATFYHVTFLLLSALSDESLRICAMGSSFGGQRLVGFGETESQRVVQAPPGCLGYTVSLTTCGALGWIVGFPLKQGEGPWVLTVNWRG